MDMITYTHASRNLGKIMSKVCDNHEPVVITRQDGAPVVMISLEDYNSIEETLYLVKSPKNAARISKALQTLEAKKTSN